MVGANSIDRGTAGGATLGFSGQNWFKARTYDIAVEAFYQSVVAGGVTDQPTGP